MVASALESVAALLVPAQLEDQRMAAEAVVSLAEHVRHQQRVMRNEPLGCDTVIDYVGWNSYEGQFGTVAKASAPCGKDIPGQCIESGNETSSAKYQHLGSGGRLANVISDGAFLVEVGPVKLGAIMRALEAASLLLRIDGCIKAGGGG